MTPREAMPHRSTRRSGSRRARLGALGLAALAFFSTRMASAEAPEDDLELTRAITRVRAYEHARIKLIEQCRPAVACMFEKGSRAGGGSGVVIDADGYGLTNFHVIAGMLGDHVGEAGFEDGRLYEYDVLGIDPTGDVAMFRVSDRNPKLYAPLGDSSSLRVGDFTLAMGNPFLLAEDYVPTVTLGIISGLHRYQAGAGDGGRALRYTDCIQVDTSINPGNSGGPLFDMAGRVIGINGRVSIEERGRVNVGVGYAISIDQIKRFIPALRAGLALPHATAGFTVRDRGSRVIVDQILDDAPAYRAGLRLGDELRVFDGREIISANQFGSYLGVFPAKWPVTAHVARNGTELDLSFRLEDMPLPKPTSGPGAADPYAAHPVTDKANRDAVDRLLRLHRELTGDEAVLDKIVGLRMSGLRTVVDARSMPASSLEIEERRSTAQRINEKSTPADIERGVRWMFIGRPTFAERESLRVTGADEVDGRICAVVRGAPADFPKLTMVFDDNDGRLLRLSFSDRLTGSVIRYEYAQFDKKDGFRVAGVRKIYFGDRLYATEIINRIELDG